MCLVRKPIKQNMPTDQTKHAFASTRENISRERSVQCRAGNLRDVSGEHQRKIKSGSLTSVRSIEAYECSHCRSGNFLRQPMRVS
jgi:hypothetical protein